jgi:hypothetical protein
MRDTSADDYSAHSMTHVQAGADAYGSVTDSPSTCTAPAARCLSMRSTGQAGGEQTVKHRGVARQFVAFRTARRGELAPRQSDPDPGQQRSRRAAET